MRAGPPQSHEAPRSALRGESRKRAGACDSEPAADQSFEDEPDEIEEDKKDTNL